MQITIQVKSGSPQHKWIETGVQRFGNDYRHQHNGKFYKIVDHMPAVRGEFSLVLEPVL